MSEPLNFTDEEFRLKLGLAEMLKGGVVMDVTNAEQARIAEAAGASAVMALERVPAGILLPAAYRLLLTAYCLLLTACSLLLSALSPP